MHLLLQIMAIDDPRLQTLKASNNVLNIALHALIVHLTETGLVLYHEGIGEQVLLPKIGGRVYIGRYARYELLQIAYDIVFAQGMHVHTHRTKYEPYLYDVL